MRRTAWGAGASSVRSKRASARILCCTIAAIIVSWPISPDLSIRWRFMWMGSLLGRKLGNRIGIMPIKDLEQKTAVVTGGASGIGLAIAEELSRRGCHLALVDLQPERLRSAQQRLVTDKQRVT